MIHALRSLSVFALALSLAACADVELDVATAREDQALDRYEYKVNPALSHWRDVEVMRLLDAPYRIEEPSISGISPNPAQRGDVITISGDLFRRMTWFGGYSVSFQAGTNRVLVTPISTTNTAIRVEVPALASTGLVRLVSDTGYEWAESPMPLVVTAPMPTTGTLRFVNASQFEVHRLTVNGQELIPWGQVLQPGSSFDVTGPGATVGYHLEMGFGLSTYFVETGSVTFTNGVTRDFEIERVGARRVLTYGAAYADWVGTYVDQNFASHTATLRFHPGGTYDLYDDGTYLGTSSYTDGTSQDYSSLIQFSIDGVATDIDLPYQSFLLANGPPSWPLIQYSRQ